MNVAEFSTRRPVTITMVFVAIVLLGLISWFRLPQELFPSVNYPQINVVTVYKNAAPEEIENQVSRFIEEAIAPVNNLRQIDSISRQGVSLVTAKFNWGTDTDFASLEVREKIDLIKVNLPREAEEPTILKYNPFSSPVMILSLTAKDSILELRVISEQIIKPELEKLDGVASVTITGGQTREILVELDQARLKASRLSVLDVVRSINDSNLNYPAGTIKEDFYEYLIRTVGEYTLVSDIAKTPISLDIRGNQDPEFQLVQSSYSPVDSRLILLSDIARVTDTFKEKTSFSRYNGKENVSISIQKQSGANSGQIAKRIHRALKRLTGKLPKDISVNTIYDESLFMRQAISNLKNAAILGGILAFLVLFLFLQEFKSSFIVTLSIPISVLATFSLMYFRGISINIISLGGLALGVGMLVDNAIVAIESIYRKKQSGLNSKQASIQGTQEISRPILASTFTTVAVFLPMIFVFGVAGQLFRQLAFTVTFSLLASLVVALLLVPRLAKEDFNFKIIKDISLFKKARAYLKRIESIYFKLLPKILIPGQNPRQKVLLPVSVIFLVSLLLLFFLNKNFMPNFKSGEFTVKLDMPAGTKLETTDLAAKKIEDFLLNSNLVKSVLVTVGSDREEDDYHNLIQTLGSNQARITVILKSYYYRNLTSKIIKGLNSYLGQNDTNQANEVRSLLGGIKINYQTNNRIFSSTLTSDEAPLVLQIKGQDLKKLAYLNNKVINRIAEIDYLYGIESDLNPSAPETTILINKDRASFYGLSTRDIANVASVAVQGYVPTKFKERSKEIDIRVRLASEYTQDFDKLRGLLISSPLGIDIPLEEVARLEKGKGPSQISRHNQQRVVSIAIQSGNQPINKVIKDIKRRLLHFNLPDGYKIDFTGQSTQMRSSFLSLIFALLLSILLVYMIMAAQFESLKQPFIIMFTVPLAIIGVAWGLFITRTSLSVIVFLGMIMLGGMVVNNAIVFISYINLLKEQKGVNSHKAVIEAARARFRPILMTSLTTILGLLPLAVGFGSGSELSRPLAITVIAGMISATFLTLWVIPILYLEFEKIKK